MQRHTPCEVIVSDRVTRERVTDCLYLHHREVPCGRELPQYEQADGAQAGPQVEEPQRLRFGTDGRPRREQVIGRESVAAAELKDPPVAGQCIESHIVRGEHSCYPPRHVSGGTIA